MTFPTRLQVAERLTTMKINATWKDSKDCKAISEKALGHTHSKFVNNSPRCTCILKAQSLYKGSQYSVNERIASHSSS